MKLLVFSSLFVMGTSVAISCQQEYSLENSKAFGSIKTIAGDCMPSGSGGIFRKGVSVDSSNFIYVDIDVYTIGEYSISSDKVNGISFHGQGIFETTGINTVRLYASGTPVTNGTVPYSVQYGSQKCIVNVFALD